MIKYIALFIAVSTSLYTYSCDCAYKPDLDSATKNSLEIFSGISLTRQVVDVLMQDSGWIILDKNDERIHTSPYVISYIKYSFRVKEKYKGLNKKVKSVDVYSPAAASACGYVFYKRKKYIVYGDTIQFDQTGGRKIMGIMTTTCFRTMPYNETENSNLSPLAQE